MYEIEIYNMTDNDMFNITTALAEAGIHGKDEDGIGKYLVDGKPRSVFVEPTDIGEAVEIINALGFQTDEDQHETETFDWES